jgi:hypothetical protein
MRHVKILIRYFDAHGELVFEGEPNLRHAVRVPVHWTRWEIYWDEELVQAGERPLKRQEPGERRGKPAPAPAGRHGRPAPERGSAGRDDGTERSTPPPREARPATRWWS